MFRRLPKNDDLGLNMSSRLLKVLGPTSPLVWRGHPMFLSKDRGWYLQGTPMLKLAKV
ncbi:uncharacterized protein DS421_16g540620 [Arachis hypogaea]|nr:uncharacterized protein DS421_16g540620 [Arachis hypogaea]